MNFIQLITFIQNAILCIYLLYSLGVPSEIIIYIDILPNRTPKEGHKARVHIKERISHSDSTEVEANL